MLGHNEVTAGLYLIDACLFFTAGRFSGRRLRDERELEIWRDGYERGCDDEAASYEPEDVPRPGDSGGRTAEVPALATMAGPVATPGHPGEVMPVAPALGSVETVRPAGPSPAAGRTIYPELAELARRDAESDSQAVAVPASVDPHWYANGLHWLADWQADWHEDVARWDAWLPGYLEWYRAGLETRWIQASRMLEAL